MSEKTEQATEAKLREARLKGDIAKSSDFTTALSSAFWFLLLGFGSIEALVVLIEWMLFFLHAVPMADSESDSLLLIEGLLRLLLVGLAIPLFCALLFILVPELIQTRGVLAVKKELFSIQRVNPVSGFKQLFSLQRFTTIVFAVLRLGILVWVMLLSGGHLLHATPFLWGSTWFMQFALLGKSLLALYGWAALCCLLLAFFDVFLQEKLWRRRNRMSKQDVRQEHRNQEGDPHMKGARQGLQQELAAGN